MAEGRYTPFGPVSELTLLHPGIVMCEGCGVVIADRATHDRFHSILGGHAWALAVLKTGHIAAHVHDRYDVPDRIDRMKFDSWTNDGLAEVMASMLEDGE